MSEFSPDLIEKIRSTFPQADHPRIHARLDEQAWGAAYALLNNQMPGNFGGRQILDALDGTAEKKQELRTQAKRWVNINNLLDECAKALGML